MDVYLSIVSFLVSTSNETCSLKKIAGFGGSYLYRRISLLHLYRSSRKVSVCLGGNKSDDHGFRSRHEIIAQSVRRC